jgi:hypothetical protein
MRVHPDKLPPQNDEEQYGCEYCLPMVYVNCQNWREKTNGHLFTRHICFKKINKQKKNNILLFIVKLTCSTFEARANNFNSVDELSDYHSQKRIWAFTSIYFPQDLRSHSNGCQETDAHSQSVWRHRCHRQDMTNSKNRALWFTILSREKRTYLAGLKPDEHRWSSATPVQPN